MMAFRNQLSSIIVLLMQLLQPASDPMRNFSLKAFLHNNDFGIELPSFMKRPKYEIVEHELYGKQYTKMK